LGKTKLLESKNAHVLVEKPFGSDAASAEELEKMFEQYIKGKQLLRVDHYLAKEGLQNMIAQRTENKELEAKLNAHFVEKIEARIFEKIGIEGRGEFYEKIGALKDVGQNHLLQMLASALMVLEDNDNKARAHALASLTLVGEPILGQYEGYTGETDVAKDSATETYFKIELESSMQQWQGVAITIEAGKAMRDKKAEVVVHFKDGTQHVFDIQHSPSGKDAYELLIEEALLGDKESFASFPEIIAAWKLLEPVFKKRDSNLIKKYTKGTNGPQ
jgi:glucose-6-phosphate 1-dehydrogenase